MDQSTLRYDQLIESHIDHLKCKYGTNSSMTPLFRNFGS